MRRLALTVALLLQSAAASRLCAQTQPETPRHKLSASPLDDALAHLDANIDEFNRTIPSFYSREEVSAEEEPGPAGIPSLRTNTSSTFVVHHAGDPDDPDDAANDSGNPTQGNQLHESRVVHIIDEKGLIQTKEGTKQSDTGARMDSSYAIFGIYSGGSTRISTAAKVCFRYRYHPARNIHGSDRIVIDFQSWSRKDRGPNCPYADNISGHGYIDPATMRLVRLEDTESDDKGIWSWSVDYSPIALGEKTFWLPALIRSEDRAVTHSMGAMQNSPSEKTISHRLTARYSKYRQAKTSPSAPAQ
jgi:hypothetical protein